MWFHRSAIASLVLSFLVTNAVEEKYYSQWSQDEFIETHIFRGFREGIFIDVGAHDGINFSNSYFFEKERAWRGVCIEPNPQVYQSLKHNRPDCVNVNKAIDESSHSNIEFYMNSGYTEMLSGVVKHYDARHFQRLQAENSNSGGSTALILVNTTTLSDLCDQQNIKHIHILSVDVEGAELAVMQSIDFTKVFVDVIVFENNYADVTLRILKFLNQYRIFRLTSLESKDIVMVNIASDFLKNIPVKLESDSVAVIE